MEAEPWPPTKPVTSWNSPFRSFQEFAKENIFTKQEITAISPKKRSDFELRINASGCSPNDFTRYAQQHEINVDSLYRKRIARLGIRARLHYGTRRIFFILDRATRKFPGEVLKKSHENGEGGLWFDCVTCQGYGYLLHARSS
ncbi:hypothetical protein FN846DRAFT_971370 [Sphaerosporella brunnea]|uniref:U3 small nucleolar RNA-associated protein 6 N-terminal domain-containing protein n=1 Tax=Sphaerosporella brunnea TaxID=1250544 RepID=A0A5J5EH83_9PEZI|nr:hypothetical protein FN846DRAFT_971370 [Sphaerosporella brunnea]